LQSLRGEAEAIPRVVILSVSEESPKIEEYCGFPVSFRRNDVERQADLGINLYFET